MDYSVILFFREIAAGMPSLDVWAEFIAGNALLKGVIPACFIWALWSRLDSGLDDRREKLLAVLALTIVAIVLGRLLSMTLPFNARPVHDANLDQSMFYDLIRNNLNGWSSFPSDHAVLFFTLATAMLYVSRAAGIILLIHAALIISLPRVIIGYHWPTDIFGGAAVGVITAVALFRPIHAVIRTIRERLHIETDAPWVSSFLFIVTFEVSSMFAASRELLSFLATATGLRG